MKVKANNLGECGVVNLFYAGTLKFDTDGATEGVVIGKIPENVVITKAVADVTTAFSAGKVSLTVGEDDDTVLADSVATATTKGAYSANAFVKAKEGAEIKATLSVEAASGEVDFYIFAAGIPE